MKKLSFIFGIMFLTLMFVQAQRSNTQSSIYDFTNGNHNNNHAQNQGNYYGSNQNYNGYYGNSNHNNHYGNNNYNNQICNEQHHGLCGANCFPPQIPVCYFPHPIIIENPVYYGLYAMENGAFQSLKSTIGNQWFSKDQLSVFEQALQKNYFTSQQVKEIIDIFTFSSDKLKVAKNAYGKTIDPENYFTINNALVYSNSVRELTAYIASF